MTGVRVVVDSSASLPQQLAEELGITVVPVQIQCGSDNLREGRDISCDEFYRRLAAGERVTTSSPSPASFVEAYRSVLADGVSIISLHVSDRASGTCNIARLVARDEFPDADITVVDSSSVSMGLGFLSIISARLAALGRQKEQIVATVEELRERLGMFAVVPTLTCLQRSGRIPHLAGLVGSILSVKPIISMRDGVINVRERVRSLPRAAERLMALAEETAGRARCLVAVIHAGAPSSAQDLAAAIKQRLDCQQVVIAEMGASLAVHGGQGMLGLITCPCPE